MAPRGEGIGPGSLNLFLALAEPNQRWLVFLGPRSVDLWQRVTVPAGTVRQNELETGRVVS